LCNSHQLLHNISGILIHMQNLQKHNPKYPTIVAVGTSAVDKRDAISPKQYYMCSNFNKIRKFYKHRSLFFLKTNLFYLMYAKFYFNSNSTLQLKRNSNIFTTSKSHQITTDFFQFTETARQFKSFQALKLAIYTKNNLFNLAKIATYFN